MKAHKTVAILLSVMLVMGLASGCKEKKPGGKNGKGGDEAGTLDIEFEVRPSILFEAESGVVTAPVQLFDDPEIPGNKYAMAPEGADHEEISEGGDVTYYFAVPEKADYALWLRARWCCECGNSLVVQVDGKDCGTVEDSTHGVWRWVQLSRDSVSLDKGQHRLVIANREDGAAWDQVLLVADKDFRPTGIARSEDVRGRFYITDCTPPK